MPIYEYSCKSCEEQFELLVLKGTTVACPSCASEELERLLSLPAVHSAGTHALAMKAAKKRDAAQGKEQMYTQLEYERNHDD